MERPERPSRHRSHDKWKRIIEPAGDSDSSEWSSDSDMGIGMNSFRTLRHLESTVGNGSSSSGSRELHSSVNSPVNSSGHCKPREPSSIFRSVEPFSFMFDGAVGAKMLTKKSGELKKNLKRYEGLDLGAGTSSSYNHLLHHDYAEREVNNDRNPNDGVWFHRPILNSSGSLGRKRPSVRAMICTPTTNSPSTSSCTPNVTTSEEGAMQDADNSSTIVNVSSNNSVVLNSEEDDGLSWRSFPSSLGRLSSPSRKRVTFMPQAESTVFGSTEADTSESVTTTLGSSSVLGSSISTQTQATQNDCTVTAEPVDLHSHPVSSEYYCPSEWYVQKKLQNRCTKQVRFSDNPFRRMSSEPSSVPEDLSHIGPRSSEDSSEIQVLSMAGPSNSSSRIVYPPGARRIRQVGPEESVSEDTNAQGLEGEDEGVEVIMVDDAQPESASEKLPVNQQNTVSSQEEQQQQQQQQQTPVSQQFKDDEYSGPASKRMREDDELLNQGLIGLLECPVCMEYMGPPIHQCRRGHLVCSSCKPKLPSCPTCRSRFTESRNLAMEKVADKLHYPCKNAHMGCTETLRLCEKDDHEANCAYRRYRCIMVPPCEWKGQRHDILTHVSHSHSETLLQGPEHVLEMRLGDLTQQSSQNWVLSALGELFRVNLGAVRGGRVQVFGCVLLLGPARRAPLFRYTMSVGPIEGDKTQRHLNYSRSTHSYVERCSVYYSAGDSFHLRTESAQLFSTGPANDLTLCVKLKVEKMDS